MFHAEIKGHLTRRHPDVGFMAVFGRHPVFNDEDFVAKKLGEFDPSSERQGIVGHDAVARPGVAGGDEGRAVGLVGRGGIGGDDNFYRAVWLFRGWWVGFDKRVFSNQAEAGEKISVVFPNRAVSGRFVLTGFGGKPESVFGRVPVNEISPQFSFVRRQGVLRQGYGQKQAENGDSGRRTPEKAVFRGK